MTTHALVMGAFYIKECMFFLVEEEDETTTPAAPAARAGIPGANVFIKLSFSLKIYSGVRGSSKKLLVISLNI